jgi:predicted transcriptional regulator
MGQTRDHPDGGGVHPLVPGSLVPALAGQGFTEPTYTQVPNELFMALPFLSDAELRVLLIIIRWSLGYHQTTCQASNADIARETGLDRRTVIRVLRRLSEAGLMTRISRFPTSRWRLNIRETTSIHLVRRQDSLPTGPFLPSG